MRASPASMAAFSAASWVTLISGRNANRTMKHVPTPNSTGNRTLVTAPGCISGRHGTVLRGGWGGTRRRRRQRRRVGRCAFGSPRRRVGRRHALGLARKHAKAAVFDEQHGAALSARKCAADVVVGHVIQSVAAGVRADVGHDFVGDRAGVRTFPRLCRGRHHQHTTGGDRPKQAIWLESIRFWQKA